MAGDTSTTPLRASLNIHKRWRAFRARAPGFNPAVNLVAFSLPLLFHVYSALIPTFYFNGILERVDRDPEPVMATIMLFACLPPIIALVS